VVAASRPKNGAKIARRGIMFWSIMIASVFPSRNTRRMSRIEPESGSSRSPARRRQAEDWLRVLRQPLGDGVDLDAAPCQSEPSSRSCRSGR
jgi:hypothetical protein